MTYSLREQTVNTSKQCQLKLFFVKLWIEIQIVKLLKILKDFMLKKQLFWKYLFIIK